MKVALLQPLRVPKEEIERLSQPIIDAGHEFVYYEDKTTDVEELYERSHDAEIVMIDNNPFPGEVIERLDQTKLINVAFTGYDHVDQKVADQKEIKIANASGYANTAVAELTIGLVLDVYRKISEGNDDIRKAEDFQEPFQGREISGKTVGIVGTGAIGVATAKLFKAFGANLIGYNRSEHDAAKEIGLEYKSFEDVLKESDIISIHLPLTDDTRGLFGRKQFEMMKEDAILINVARGPIVDDKALAEALRDELIQGAGIDVFDGEPPLPSDYPLLDAPNAVLTPHVGFLSDEAMVRRAEIAFENTLAFLEGHPKNIVN